MSMIQECISIHSSYNLRPINDNEIRKVNHQIDEKISRRRQQQYEHEQKSKQAPQQPAPKPEPTRSSTSDASRSLMNSAAPPSNEEEHSIFRDPAPSTSRPTSARVIQFLTLQSYFLTPRFSHTDNRCH